MIPNYLCIGHVCQDIKEDGYILGGSASYSSIAAHLLGRKVGVVTSFGNDFQFLAAFENIAIHNKKATTTTLFENVYNGNHRIQYLHQRAETIYIEDIPRDWLATPLVHFSTIADEADFSVLKAFHPKTIIAATPQGWMRQWDEVTRKVSPKTLDWNQLTAIDILILSDEDIEGYEHLFSEIITAIDLVVLTRGEQPASVYFDGQVLDFPVYKVEIIDPTGAGDTFATGFLVKYMETKDIRAAMAYGHVVASFCIENVGLKGLKGLEMVERRYMEYLEGTL